MPHSGAAPKNKLQLSFSLPPTSFAPLTRSPRSFPPFPLPPPPQRNFFYILMTCHWFACFFFWLAEVEHFTPQSWVGRAEALVRFQNEPAFIR